MERIIKFDERALEEALKLTPQERLRQANAAFRLYYSLHHPYEKPWAGAAGDFYGRNEGRKEGNLSA